MDISAALAVANVKPAVASYTGMRMTLVLHGHDVSFTVHEGTSLVPVDTVMAMDGYETIHIRRRAPARPPPIIALLTATAVGGERQRCLGARSDDVIPQPANSTRLLPAIVPWLPQPAGAGT